jgi:hypothetical protein
MIISIAPKRPGEIECVLSREFKFDPAGLGFSIWLGVDLGRTGNIWLAAQKCRI